MNRLGVLTFTVMLLIFNGFLSVTCSAQVTANWTGSVSNDWNTAGNWSTGAVPGTADSVQIGLVSYARQPVIGASVHITSLLFGGASPDTLTVSSGDTLTVSGTLIQSHSADNTVPSTLLIGSGSIYCGSVIIGNNILPRVVMVKASTFRSQVASFNISGNLTIRSATIDLLSGAIAHNNSIFSLEAGQLNLSGQLYLDNFIPSYLATLPGIRPLSKFLININSNNNATLVLSDSVAVVMTHTGCDSIDFYHYTSGTGKSIVNYAGGDQLLYTNNTPGMDTLPYTYQNLSVTTAGTKTAGDTSAGNNLNVGGDLKILSGTLDMLSFSAACTVYGNFTNDSTIDVGSSGITFKGPSFFNSGQFNHDNAWVTFSGGTQALTDSTAAGTNLRFVAFADTGTKSIQKGTFAVIPSGKVSLSNDVTVSVDSTAVFILRSDSTGTAAITAIPAGSVIDGIINAEWFVQGSWTNLNLRTYHLMSSAVNHTGNTDGTGDYNINWLNGTTLYNGAILTGPLGSTNGFYNPAGNPTLYFYREDVNYNGGAFTSGNYRGVNKINNTDINDVGTQKRFTTTATADTTVRVHIGNGILFFFRGNKVSPNGTTSGTKTTSPFNYPESVTFTNQGTANQGQVQVQLYFRANNYLSYTDSSYISNAQSRGFNMVGNPYPSAINWDNFSATDSTAAIYGPGLNGTISVYNPLTKVYDTYQADPTHNRDSVYYSPDSATNIIASGQGFFVLVDSTSANKLTASLRFREPAKFNPPSTTGGRMLMALRRAAPVKAALVPQPVKKAAAGKAPSLPKRENVRRDIHIRLTQGKNTSDRLVINFGSGGTTVPLPPPDPDSSIAAAVTLRAYTQNNQLLKAVTVPLPARLRSVRLHADAAITGTYTLGIEEIRNLPNYRVRLTDKLTGKTIDARKQPKYAFRVDKNNPKSYGDRFMLTITKGK